VPEAVLSKASLGSLRQF